MDKETRIVAILAIVFVIALCLGMFFLGRKSVHIPEPSEITHDTAYVFSPYAVHDTIFKPLPSVVTPPDTVYYPVPEPVDTAALFAVWLDYYSTREYDLDFSSDTLGVFKVAATVNQNKITQAESTIQPITKVITTTQTFYKTKFIQPWVMVGTGVDFRFQEIQAGVDFKGHWVVGVGGIRYDNNFGFVVNAGYKF